MKIKRKPLLILSVCALAGAAFGGHYYLDNRDLSFMTNQEWSWLDKDKRIQSRFDEDEQRPILRKVYRQEKYVVYVGKDDNYSPKAMVVFDTQCKPNSVIETDSLYSDGKPKMLHCTPEGDRLYYAVSWEGKDTDIYWQDNLGGFVVDEDLAEWDLSVVDKYITLLKAKTLD